MRTLLDEIYFFVALCANFSVIATVLGGHATQDVTGSSTAFSSGASDPVLLVVNLIFIAATIVLAFPKIPQMFQLLRMFPLLSVLYGLAGFSILWSTDRGSTFRNVLYLAIYLVSAMYIALRFGVEDIIRMIGRDVTILALVSIPGQFLLPPDPVQPEAWKGVFSQKNELGIAMAIGVTALFYMTGRMSIGRSVSVLICSGMLLLSHSASSIALLILTFGISLVMKMRRHFSIVLLAISIGLAAAAAIAGTDIEGTFTNSTGKDLTLTGRTFIWYLVAEKISERPVLGYGYGAFWATEADSVNTFLKGFKPGQAHNGYLEACLDVGVVGLVLIMVFIVNAMRLSMRLRGTTCAQQGKWLFTIIALLIVHNFSESDFMFAHAMWFVSLISVFSSAILETEIEEEASTTADITGDQDDVLSHPSGQGRGHYA